MSKKFKTKELDLKQKGLKSNITESNLEMQLESFFRDLEEKKLRAIHYQVLPKSNDKGIIYAEVEPKN